MTYKGKKSGFSLVEVMVLFTVLSIALVGSMKMITRKKSAIPKKASHGVYRCIATQNGYFQELYRGSHRVDSGNTSECKFRVPEAAMYTKNPQRYMYLFYLKNELETKIDDLGHYINAFKMLLQYGL